MMMMTVNIDDDDDDVHIDFNRYDITRSCHSNNKQTSETNKQNS